MNRVVLKSAVNSGPSVGASSLVTDGNSALSGGPHLQRSASFNTESYMRLPASPLSFSSNNISMSGSSVLDGCSVMQQTAHQDQSSQQVQRRHHQQQKGASTATSHPTSQTGQAALPSGPQVPSSLNRESLNLLQMQKKPRLDIKQEDIMQQQVFQELLQKQDPMQLQDHSPQLQALIQQQRLRLQQQQILQSMPQMQRAQLQQQQQQQQQQMRLNLQQQAMPQTCCIKRPYDSGVCARRLMQYIYHQRQRPPDNTIIYWRKFVAEYYAPRAKKRWCLSLYDNVGHHGVFPQAAMDAWQCDICGSRTGRGFEATFEVLPRLSKIKFDSGVIDELLFVDLPRECRFPSGIMMLEYGKAIQESVYEQLRVVREGQLRIIFAPDLKILSWEFCARRHEELLPRRLVAPQVNQLVQVAHKYQNTVTENGSDGVSMQELQTNCNMFVSAGRQLAKNLEFQSLNDLGFSKRYIRCLQISEVVNSMKDLIDFSREHNIGPIDSLKNYPRRSSASKIQMQKMEEMEQLASAQGLPTNRNTINRLMAMHTGLSGNLNNNHHLVSGGVPNSTAQASAAPTNYQNLLRQSSIISNQNVPQQVSGSLNCLNRSQYLPFQDSRSLASGSMQNLPVNGLSSPHQRQQQQQQHSFNANSVLQQNHPQSSQGTQNIQQHMIQQLLQEMSSNSGGGVQQQLQSHGGQNANGRHVGEDVFTGANGSSSSGLSVKAGNTGIAGCNSATTANVLGNVTGTTSNSSNSVKAASDNNFSGVGHNNSFNQRTAELPQNLQLPEMVHDIVKEFTENGIFNSDPGDMGYGWKA